MSLYYTLGEINDPCRKMHVEWKIPGYFKIAQNVDDVFVSPPIHFFHTQWNILLYPNGSRQKHSDAMIDMYLEVINPIANYPVTFTLGIKGVRTLGPKSVVFNQHNCRVGWSHMLKRNNLLQHMLIDSSIETLTVCCDAIADISAVVDKACQTTFLNSTSLLCRDFKELLQNGEKSDFTIYVHDHVFKVHKIIMESRSTVFAAMFRNDTRENREGVVTIDDDCDPDAFGYFLQHVYTGQVENISWDNTIHLFSIADKYGMLDLKSQCMEIMRENISEENVCDILLVADRHSETQLKNFAETFLIQNIVQIKTTDKWKSFVAKNQSLVLDIFKGSP